ncbi:bleomycin resistance protein [Candidatus Acetothermia bacterium]|nr:MAG: bleomycin resistance protein [Candidatus Acetothermia bacterium]
MSNQQGVYAGITFFYYEDLEPAARFYRETMGFSLVYDQGWAKIFRIAGNTHIGIVAGEKGFCRPQEKNAVLLTVVVDDVNGWYERLRKTDTTLLTEVLDKPDINVHCFFLQDPAGYAIEVQQFTDPHVAQEFRSQ